jgi:hypothetical protein
MRFKIDGHEKPLVSEKSCATINVHACDLNIDCWNINRFFYKEEDAIKYLSKVERELSKIFESYEIG